MKLIVDANIIFSALIKNATTREIILLSTYEFYIPEFIFTELKKHFLELEEKTGLNKNRLNEILNEFFSIIRIIPFEEYSSKILEAEKICPDKDDIDYFALALKFNCGIWSNDKILKEQDKIKVYNTKELISF